MTTEIGSWRDLVPADERRQYERADFGRKVALGHSPALIVVDMTRMMFDPAYPMSPDHGASDVVDGCEQLVAAARARGWPIVWSRRGDRRLPAHRGVLDLKWETGGLDEGADEFVAPLVPGPDDLVVTKAKPSAFFETPLRSQLTFLGVDTVVACGMSTSGCVRATVTDAFSSNFRVLVVEEATGDRSPSAHRANLYDMDQKLATVVTLGEFERMSADTMTTADR